MNICLVPGYLRAVLQTVESLGEAWHGTERATDRVF